jgi:hypothetical protein
MTYRHEVYFNLHKQCLSIRRVSPYRTTVDHFEAVVLSSVTFAVQPAGRERVRIEGKKNVHAFVRGEIEYFQILGGYPVIGGRPERLINEIMLDPNMQKITYNPYKYDSFVDVNTLTPVTQADKVYIVGRDIYAVGAK